ncbi:DUF3800 domain-containing protein [Falsihalocynthiibacter sp. S25ZX9]|uniref:DUF3800 domain-containing protein n=1 Tax=Falsihalocynthiibacter sp. S25ZX9 TaxID=3240870 RepID=UPI00350FA338
MTARLINIYCDESCHLENDRQQVMVLGGVYCDVSEIRRISSAIRGIKDRHQIAPGFEIKWTKVSNGALPFYRELIAFFLNDTSLRFRGVLVPDKAILDHAAHDQTHDEWYYKMYFLMLRYVFSAPHSYNVYLDIKDTRGSKKVQHMHEVLCNSIHDFDHQTIHRVQQIRSHESPILQLADLLIGAVAYQNRGLVESAAKMQLIEDLKLRLGENILSRSSSFGATKFNLFRWEPIGGANDPS